MARFPSGVTIVTTRDDTGRRWGFTATSFCSVSMDPELILVCLSTGAECHSAFRATTDWLVHIIPPELAELARRFATRGADKFSGPEVFDDDNGLPRLRQAAVVLRCTTHAQYPGGDHVVLLGRVHGVALGTQRPAVYVEREFHPLS